MPVFESLHLFEDLFFHHAHLLPNGDAQKKFPEQADKYIYYDFQFAAS